MDNSHPELTHVRKGIVDDEVLPREWSFLVGAGVEDSGMKFMPQSSLKPHGRDSTNSDHVSSNLWPVKDSVLFFSLKSRNS